MTRLHQVSACVGVYPLSRELGYKHTENVGSDDCGQRSWEHLTSFKVLREPRIPKDIAICIGEAQDVWTLRIAQQANCSGMALGISWTHKSVFYIGHDARGPKMCVRYKIERGHNARWSRWQVVHKGGKSCGSGHGDGYKTEFIFKSMADTYIPQRLYICDKSEKTGKFRLEFDCDTGGDDPVTSFTVLLADPAAPTDEVYCIGRSAAGDRLVRG